MENKSAGLIICISGLFGLLLLTPSCSNQEKNAEIRKINQTDDQGLKQGLWHTYFDDGSVKSEVNYENDLKTGKEMQYFPDGNINIEMEWLAYEGSSTLHSGYKHYNNEGKLTMEMWYDDGIPDSIVTYYYQDGTLQQQGKYKDGMRVGIWRTYRDDGSLATEVDYAGYAQSWTEDLSHGRITYFTQTAAPYFTELFFKGQKLSDSILDINLFELNKLNHHQIMQKEL